MAGNRKSVLKKITSNWNEVTSRTRSVGAATRNLNIMITVTITDDKRDIRDGIQIMLKQAEDIKCIGVFEDGKSSIEGNLELKPDIALMDIGLPDISGIECVRTLKQQLPKMDLIMLTVKSDDESVFKSLKAGACGYLTKNVFPTRLLNAIREAKDGGAPMSSSIARLVVSSFNSFKNPGVRPYRTGT